MLTRKVQHTGRKGAQCSVLTIPAHITHALNIKKGDEIQITLDGEKIVLTPVPHVRQDFEGDRSTSDNRSRWCADNGK
jgi:AbrB family looped-hinge helix DNA binding protein